MEVNVYGIFRNGYLVDKGTRVYICDKYHVGRKSFYEYLKPWRRLNGKYTLERINGDEEIEMVEEEKIDENVDEERFNYLFSMLKIYGNTCSVFDPVPYIGKLKDKGIIAESRKSSFGGYYIEVMA